MRHLFFRLLLAAALPLTLAGFSGCCCCSDYADFRSNQKESHGPRRSPARSVCAPKRVDAQAVQVLWTQPATMPTVVAVLSQPATDEATAIAQLKKQAARLGANAIARLQVAQGVMTCEAVYVQQ